jgi:hypothetical protein
VRLTDVKYVYRRLIVPDQDHWTQGLLPRIADEVNHIISAFAEREREREREREESQREERKETPETEEQEEWERKITISGVREDAGVGYMYAEDQLLVLEQHLGPVLDSMGRLDIDISSRNPDRVLSGLVIVHFRGRSVPDVLDVIDTELGVGRASPNHVLTLAPGVGPCPATDPEEVYDGTEPYPSVCQCNSGADVRIYIADTGLLSDAESHPWLAGVRGEPDPLTPGPTGVLKPYAGHGTFVAGVARCMAPAAEIFVGNVFATGGSALETDFVKDLQRALHRGTDIFHLSVASPTRRNLQPLGFWEWLKELRQHKGIACVAAAGNNESRRPHWPGASPHVVSVGALAADWRSRANFSNHGGWVDVYAPGRDLVNAYTSGTFTCEMVPYAGQVRTFFGMAKWSGTSFSSPIMTGLIAARMWRTGENGSEAAAALLKEARRAAIPGVGAIVLPCCGDRGCRCRRD